MIPDNDRPGAGHRARSNSNEPPTSSKQSYLISDCLWEWVDFYVDRAWPILPIHCTDYESCSCTRGLQCPSAGKHPRNRNGLHGASTEMRTIRSWLRQWHNINLGIATGGPHDLLVIDVDPRHGGDTTIDDLQARYDILPRTYTVRTGRGGLHLYFSMEGIDPPIRNSQGRLGLGLDVRGEGGYVVAPPSETPFGAYTVEVSAPLAPIPGWVVDLLRVRAPRQPQRPRNTGSQRLTQKGAEAVVQRPRSLDEAVLFILRASEGTRNHTLNCMAFWAGRQVALGLLCHDDVVIRFTVAAHLTGLDDDEIDR